MKYLFYLFLTSLPFGTRLLVHQFTPGFHEYEAIFLYASDIFLILFLITAMFSHSNVLKNVGMRMRSQFWAALFLFFAAISIFFSVSAGLAVYSFIRLLLLAALSLTIAFLLKENVLRVKTIFAVIAGSAVLQSLIAVGQFIKQGSLGLAILGESFLGPNVDGAAKIVIEGGKILRAYGTFPHPNVLAAFLLLGLLSLYYLWTSHVDRKLSTCDVVILIGIFVTLLGLLLTFSRTAWLIAVLGTLVLAVLRRNWRLAFFSFAIFVLLFAFFHPYILPRARIVAEEPAVVQRLAYNEMAVELITTRPFGVGIGNQVLYSVKNGLYEKFGMAEIWQWQPIHNIYLLIGAETGILGLIAFLVFIIWILFRNWKLEMRNYIPNIMLLALLMFGMADHFLWTLQPGRLMLWLMIGIVIGVSSARSSTDRTHPSEG